MANSIKKANMLKLVNIIKNSGLITKPELATLSGLTSVTVHNFVNELMEKEIVLEEGNADSIGGRRAVLYRINSKLFNIIGIHFAVTKITISIFDLDLNILYSYSKNCKLDLLTVDEGIRLILDMVYSILNEVDIKIEKIIGIGVLVPGPVNYEKGLIYELPNLPKWRDIPIADIIGNDLRLPVYVDKDNNGALLDLKWRKVLRNAENVVYLSTIEGVGTGILLNGEIYRGNRCAAGEVGHITVEMNGPKCNCGNYGCLELYASDLAIINSLIMELKKRKEGILYNMCCSDLNSINIALAVEAAKKGDQLVKEVFHEAGRFLSVCIGNILKMYAPMEVIIESTWLGEFKEVYYSILDYVYETSNFFERNDVRIALNTLENSVIFGTATIVLDRLFKTYENNKLLSQII